MSDEEPSDSALLGDVVAGDERAFAALYRRRRRDVYRFAFAMSRSPALAQDVTQDIFLRLLEHGTRFDPSKGSVRAWLLGAARHAVLDRLRSDSRWAGSGAAAEATAPCRGEDEVLTAQRRARLHAAIAALPFEYREALVLCDLAELSYAECAAILRRPIGTVRSRLHRARAMLAERVGGSERSAAAPFLKASEVY